MQNTCSKEEEYTTPKERFKFLKIVLCVRDISFVDKVENI